MKRLTYIVVTQCSFVICVLSIVLGMGTFWYPATLYCRLHTWKTVVALPVKVARGCLVETELELQAGHGNVLIGEHIKEQLEENFYQPPPGFDYDPKLAAQVTEDWYRWQSGQHDEPLIGCHDGAPDIAALQSGFEWWNRLGFGGGWIKLPVQTKASEFSGSRGLTVPLWLVILVTVILPIRRSGFFLRRQRRTRTGHCPACGYDLRASAGKCPECGAETVAASR